MMDPARPTPAPAQLRGAVQTFKRASIGRCVDEMGDASKTRRVVAVVVLWALFAFPPLSWASGWRAVKSDHFQVFYLEDRAFASEVSRTAERLYTAINAELGFDRVVKKEHLSFWLWEDRCQIYLYRTRAEFVRSTGAPTWSAGFVNYRDRIIHSYNGAETFLDSTLQHELAHILFREYVGLDNPNVPRWLDEGVAQYAERDRRERALEFVREGLQRDRYFPFIDFHGMRLRPADGEAAVLYYRQAVSVVHFFIARYGSSRFIDFCSNLRDGYSIERALSFATGGSIDSLEDLEGAWKRFFE